jgi:hypothetical protein
MSSVEQVIYSCDRCGAQVVSPGAAFGRVKVGEDYAPMPDGWCIVDVQPGAMPELCKECIAAFWEWMGKTPDELNMKAVS